MQKVKTVRKATRMKSISKCKTVAELLSRTSRWTKGQYAVDSEGEVVSPRSKKAERFCLLGACKRVYGNGKKSQKMMNKLRDAVRTYGFYGVPEFNDNEGVHFWTVKRAIKLAGV